MANPKLLAQRLEAMGLRPALEVILSRHKITLVALATSKTKRVCKARRELWQLLRKTGMSYAEIAQVTGHTAPTVWIAIKGRAA